MSSVPSARWRTGESTCDLDRGGRRVDDVGVAGLHAEPLLDDVGAAGAEVVVAQVGRGAGRASGRTAWSLRVQRRPSHGSKVSPRQNVARSVSTVNTTSSVSSGRWVMSSESVERSDGLVLLRASSSVGALARAGCGSPTYGQQQRRQDHRDQHDDAGHDRRGAGGGARAGAGRRGRGAPPPSWPGRWPARRGAPRPGCRPVRQDEDAHRRPRARPAAAGRRAAIDPLRTRSGPGSRAETNSSTPGHQAQRHRRQAEHRQDGDAGRRPRSPSAG